MDNKVYDICLDYKALCDCKDKLNLILYNLDNSVNLMTNAISYSRDFLSGRQFEKAKETTLMCLDATKITQNNIRHAMRFLDELKEILNEYEKYKYNSEGT